MNRRERRAPTSRKRGRPSLGPRWSIITAVPTAVREELDAIAAAAETSRGVTISDLTALAVGRPDLAHRLKISTPLAPPDPAAVAGTRPVGSSWCQVTTYVPVALLPVLDALVAETGNSRRSSPIDRG